MNLAEDQRYFLSILRETGFIRLDQVLPLLRINEPQKEIIHAGALLRRLRYMGLLARSGDGCICLPDLLRDRPDSEILLSLDVLLALRPERLLQVSARQPYATKTSATPAIPICGRSIIPEKSWTACSRALTAPPAV